MKVNPSYITRNKLLDDGASAEYTLQINCRVFMKISKFEDEHESWKYTIQK